ncbi:hypothetical protein TEA_025515 [Camellia sinensis var. sinensis]|uniref:Uncharacterized protein n=1 Tax=Camellia sinensis var. sinensis TaxID=542762 RepID=A0A4S4CX31_CAMSN|nr:hypothetical protein TEA_025515 [Camellia sinensis var. sinensis]
MESHTCAYYYVTSPSGSPMSSPSPLPSSAAHSRYQSASDVLVQAPSDLEIQESMPGLIEDCRRTSPRREIMRRNTGRTPTCGCGINISISIRPMLLKIAEALRNKLGSFLEEVNSSSSMCTDDNVVFRLILTVTALILEVALRRLERLSLSFNSPGSVPPTPTPVHGGGEGEN